MLVDVSKKYGVEQSEKQRSIVDRLLKDRSNRYH